MTEQDNADEGYVPDPDAVISDEDVESIEEPDPDPAPEIEDEDETGTEDDPEA